MPITRSQAESYSTSEGCQETAGGLTPAEIEILSKRIEERERILHEQSEALRKKQEDLEELRRDMEQAREPPHSQELNERMYNMERVLAALPGQMDNLKQLVANMKHDRNIQPDRNTHSSFLNESIVRNERQEISPIRLKDVIDSIPKYDGHKMSVFHFCKICERALNLIPKYQEYHLVQLIINKLYGHAYAAIEGSEYVTVFDITRRLRKIFGPNKSTDQYRGELANIYMKPNENLLDYVERVKELRTSILDGETTESGYIDAPLKESIEISARDSFVNGLPSDLLIRVKLEGYFTLEDAVTTAIQLSKTLEAENLRKRGTVPKFQSKFRADVSKVPNAPKDTSEQIHRSTGIAPFVKPLIPGQPGPNYPEKVCYYCKAPGHFMKDCRKLAYKNVSTGNAASVPVTGVRRDATPVGRPSMNIMTVQEVSNPLPPTSPN